jgi:integrase
MKAAEGPTLDDFPDGLRISIETYLTGLTVIRRNKAGQRIRPCKPSTITMRRRELVAAVRMAVNIGIPLTSMTSLAAFIHPDVAERVCDAYWQKDGKVPSTYTINLACRFFAVACAIGSFDADALLRLEDLRFTLEQEREDGITEKNLRLIRSVLTDGVWSRVAKLPEQLMERARRERHAPVKAAVHAQIAVAVAILTVAPIRLGNLASIRLGENLTKPGGPESNYWLTFAKYEVKNRQPLHFKLDEEVTALINEYVHDFRPALVRGSNANWLFPGEAGEQKEKVSFSTQIVERVQKSTGLRITVHQFRHAAGALILKHRPGEYELVRRVLGHKSVETTMKFYLALETTQASEIFTDIIRNKLELA